MFRYKLRTLLAVLAAIGVALALARQAATHIYPSVIYQERAEFAELPPSDASLEQWLREQPGVVSHTVHVEREKNMIRITWIMSRNLVGDPPIPDFRNNFERLGYKGLKRHEY